MRRPSLVLVFLMTLSLAACGGGGGSSGGGGLPPTPTPTPTQTPINGPTPAVVQGPGRALTGNAIYQGGWTPYGVASRLDFPVQHGWNGTGQGVAVVMDSKINASVVATYLSTFGITESGKITQIAIDGGATGTSDQDEAYLDVETIAGLAPGANIYVYEIPDISSDKDLADAYSKINSDGNARVVNNSFGGCEFPNPPEDSFVAQGAAAGIAYIASGGDNGNVCNPPTQVGANWPASNPNMIGVGGTETGGSFATLTSDTVWNDKSCSGNTQCAGGGGVSGIYTLPTYQVGVAGESSTANRNVPDLSLPAESDNVYDGSWFLINGTSWSSPQYAALMAEVYQYCNVVSGIANPVDLPYYVARQYDKAYIDTVSGNDEFGSTTPFYTAGPGYDNASGFGVPYGMAFANTLCPNRTQAPGVLARSAAVQAVAEQPTTTLDVTPRVGGLVDLGQRSTIAATPVQIVLRSEGDRAAVESALQQAGFSIDHTYEYQRIVDAQAPSGTVEAFFRTRMHDVLQPGHGTRYLPATQIALPDSIASHVVTVNLQNVATRHVLDQTWSSAELSSVLSQ
ncbi:MAG TPA: protease pro-enzyme activation domain-containing protein [Candidatus Baltobacteraceae bacterium]|nr:protease pro-enzyme activation domain-containing protein [Candidatus Baltobacteraceae bacterium]